MQTAILERVLISALLFAACTAKKDAHEPTQVIAPTNESAKEAPPSIEKKSALVEVVDDVAVLRLDVTGFDALTKDERLYAYWMAEAAIAGDPIVWDQRGEHNLALKEMAEEVILHADASPEMAAFRVFAKKLWIHKGIYDAFTYEKWTPAIEKMAMKGILARSVSIGAKFTRFRVHDVASLDAKWPLIEKVLYDETYQPRTLSKSPAKGEDILTASFNTYYPGVRLAELDGYHDQFPLNSRIEKRNGKLVETPYRSGGDGVEPGLYADSIQKMRDALAKAKAHATDAQKREIDHLYEYFRTGNNATFRAYNIEWVKNDPNIDAILGFIEVYGDPRATKAEFEGAILMRDSKLTAVMKKLAENAAYFEAKMPWLDVYKREKFDVPVANAFQVLVETGASGPVSPVGINLPNEAFVRQNHGSKNFLLTSVLEAGVEFSAEAMAKEFTFDPATLPDVLRCERPMWIALVAMHEVTGHGSGRVKKELEMEGKTPLREYGSALEEARADLVALHLAWDPKAKELGVTPDDRCAEMVADSYARGMMLRLRAIPTGDAIEDDHIRSESLVVRYAESKGAVEVKKRDGKIFLVVTDQAKWRAATAELLAELMRIKAEGDYAAAKSLIEKFGAKLVPEWRDDVVRRVRELGFPPNRAYLSPRIAPVRGPEGAIVDARLVTGLGLEETALIDAGRRPLP